MVHDFKRFPELTKAQFNTEYFNSPHKQITEDIFVLVEKVHDGDTITVSWDERDFNFPVRFANNAAPELDEEGGIESGDWMRERLLGEEVKLMIDDNRVGKFGRLVAKVIHAGIDMGIASINAGHSLEFNKSKNNNKLTFDEFIGGFTIK